MMCPKREMNIKGGTVIETESNKIKIRVIIEMGQEMELDDAAILQKLSLTYDRIENKYKSGA